MDELLGFGSMVLEEVVFAAGEHAKTSNTKTPAGINFLISTEHKWNFASPSRHGRGLHRQETKWSRIWKCFASVSNRFKTTWAFSGT